MNLDPDRAPKRPDLSFLTVRSARTLRSAASTAPPVPASAILNLHPETQPLTAPAPGVSSSLDLDDPPQVVRSRGTGPAVRNRVGHIGGPLPQSPATGTGALWKRPRLPLGGRVVLSPAHPALTLSRLSSAIGSLNIHAATSPALGDIVLTCAYELLSEPGNRGVVGQLRSSVLAGDGTTRSAPADDRRPVLVYGRGEFPRISVDLRQVRRVRRLLVLTTTRHGGPVDWAGTLILSTHGGARVEVELDELGNTATGAVLALFQVDGELIARAELEQAASVREACKQFGYDAITWIDDRTPLG